MCAKAKFSGRVARTSKEAERGMAKSRFEKWVAGKKPCSQLSGRQYFLAASSLVVLAYALTAAHLCVYTIPPVTHASVC